MSRHAPMTTDFKPQHAGILKQLDHVGAQMENEDLTDEARATVEAIHYNLLLIRKAQRKRSLTVSTNQFIS